MAVRRPHRLRNEYHRGHRLDLFDDRGGGWVVVIYGTERGACRSWDEIRGRVPNGLSCLLAEARRRIDRRLDGSSGPLGQW